MQFGYIFFQLSAGSAVLQCFLNFFLFTQRGRFKDKMRSEEDDVVSEAGYDCSEEKKGAEHVVGWFSSMDMDVARHACFYFETEKNAARSTKNKRKVAKTMCCDKVPPLVFKSCTLRWGFLSPKFKVQIFVSWCNIERAPRTAKSSTHTPDWRNEWGNRFLLATLYVPSDHSPCACLQKRI